MGLVGNGEWKIGKKHHIRNRKIGKTPSLGIVGVIKSVR